MQFTDVKPNITYFGIQGAAEKVRLAFVLNGVDFDDNRVGFADWPALKPTTPFGQLPIMDLGNGKVIAQSDAMLRYVAGKLMPTDPMSALEVNHMLGLIADFDRDWLPCLYMGMNPTAYGYPEEYKGSDEQKANIKKLRENFVENKLGQWLAHYEKYLKQNGDKFLCGSEPTIADCAAIPQLRKFSAGFIDHVPTTTLDAYPAIQAYIERFLAIPEVTAHYAEKK